MRFLQLLLGCLKRDGRQGMRAYCRAAEESNRLWRMHAATAARAQKTASNGQAALASERSVRKEGAKVGRRGRTRHAAVHGGEHALAE